MEPSNVLIMFKTTIANGSKSPIHGIGIVSMFDFILSFVLYIPNFPSNILFVCKLVSHLNCSITFYPSYCIFQDLKIKKTIDGRCEKMDSNYCCYTSPLLSIQLSPHTSGTVILVTFLLPSSIY